MNNKDQHTNDSLELSYQMQSENFTQKDDHSMRLQESWFNDDTVDFWRHHRFVAPLKPLLETYNKSKWLTIGDGRFGLDSIRLKKLEPGLDILPTDISIELLKQAKERNLIPDYRYENAEKLSFEDNAFDITFCKESYHHFPRPYIALYEMLRVSKKAVILIEPNERYDMGVPEHVMNAVKRRIKKLIGRPSVHPETWNFEVSGNYIYKVSKLEIEKVGLGLQLPVVAFYFFNDYYEEGVEFEKAEQGNSVFERTKRKIAKEDRRCELGLKVYTNIIAILFKEPPDQNLRNALTKNNFEVIDLPVNPYMQERKDRNS